MWKLPNNTEDEDFSEFPDREDFETFEEAGKLVVKRHFLEVDCMPVEMAVTPSLLNGLKNAIENSVIYEPPLPRID